MFDKDNIIKTQLELSNLIGLSGRESNVAQYILNNIKQYVDQVEIDSMGNVVARKKSSQKNAKTIVLDAHMDEVGFMVNHITEKGFLKVTSIGGINAGLLPGLGLKFYNKDVRGIFCYIPPHLRATEPKEVKVDDLTIDIGAESIDDVKKAGIDIGSTCTFDTIGYQMNDNTVCGKAFDDRTGCNILLQLAKTLKDSKNNIIFSFSVQEEYSSVGPKTVIESIKEDVDTILIIENTFATDIPGISEEKKISRLGKGPALTVADRSYIVPENILNNLKKTADDNKINWQYKKPSYGGTNAGSYAGLKAKIPVGIISVPCRYIHGPISLLRIGDLINTIELIFHYIN